MILSSIPKYSALFFCFRTFSVALEYPQARCSATRMWEETVQTPEATPAKGVLSWWINVPVSLPFLGTSTPVAHSNQPSTHHLMAFLLFLSHALQYFRFPGLCPRRTSSTQILVKETFFGRNVD